VAPGLVIADDRLVRPIVEKAREDLAARLSRSEASIPEPTVESVQWRDSAMGIKPHPEEPIIRKPTPGYVLRFNVSGRYHLYHARLADCALKYDSYVGAHY
jgi:hypothetical protein